MIFCLNARNIINNVRTGRDLSIYQTLKLVTQSNLKVESII